MINRNKIKRHCELKRKNIHNFEKISNLMTSVSTKVKNKKYSKDDLHYFVGVLGEHFATHITNLATPFELPNNLGLLQVVATDNNVSNVNTKEVFMNAHSLGRTFYLRYNKIKSRSNPVKNASFYKISTLEFIRNKISTNAKNGVIYPYPKTKVNERIR